MSYKLGEIPSPKASFDEKADYLEIKCLKSETLMYSIQEAASASRIVTDEDYSEKIVEELPYYEELRVIDDRKKQCGGNYPFLTDSEVWGLYASQESVYIHTMYTYLLLATRNDMGRNRIVDGVDGGKLFERLCSLVLKNYFGEHCHSFVFGTGDDAHTNFKARLQNFLEQVNEPKTQVVPIREGIEHTQDDALDVVVNIPFGDKRSCQFMAFCQCKTGDNWKNSIVLLSPSNFSRCYFNPPLHFTPIIVHMVTEAYNFDWYHVTRDVVFFDRCRIMRYLPSEEMLLEKDAHLISEIRTWNNGILQQIS